MSYLYSSDARAMSRSQWKRGGAGGLTGLPEVVVRRERNNKL